MKKALTIILFTVFSVFHGLAQETVTYQPAQYPGDQKELVDIVSKKELLLSKKLFKAMVDENIREVRANVWLIINSKGKLVGIDVVEATHPLFNEDCFPKIVKNLKDIDFIPGSIDGEPVTTAILIEDLMIVIEPVVN